MLEYVKGFISLGSRLNVEERSLLSVAYKNITGTLRSSWRVISHIEDSDGRLSNDKERALMRDEKGRIEGELISVCEDILNLLATTLIPAASPGDETVFYHKM